MPIICKTWSRLIKRSSWKYLGSLVGAAVLLIAAWTLRKEIQEVHLAEVLAEVHRISSLSILSAMVTTFVCYLMLTCYDVLAFQYLQFPLGYWRILFAAFIGYAFSNNISMTPSVAIRFRMYSTWGVSVESIAKVFVFHIVGTWMGYLTVGGGVFLFEALPTASIPFLSSIKSQSIGILFLSLVTSYFIFIAFRRRPIQLRKLEIQIPSLRISLLQLLVASLDWALCGSVLYLLLPDTSRISYSRYLAAYLVTQAVAINSHVPGGLGVFEGTIIFFLSPYFSVSELIGSLLLYRIIYHIIPLLIGSSLFFIFEITQRRVDGR